MTSVIATLAGLLMQTNIIPSEQRL